MITGKREGGEAHARADYCQDLTLKNSAHKGFLFLVTFVRGNNCKLRQYTSEASPVSAISAAFSRVFRRSAFTRETCSRFIGIIVEPKSRRSTGTFSSASPAKRRLPRWCLRIASEGISRVVVNGRALRTSFLPFTRRKPSCSKRRSASLASFSSIPKRPAIQAGSARES